MSPVHLHLPPGAGRPVASRTAFSGAWRFQRQTAGFQLLLGPICETKSMSPIETELLQALLDLESNIKPAGTPGPRPSLLPFFERIDQLGAKLGPDADPSLRHYLQKKSYQKARFFLQGRDAENVDGPCGHV